MELLIQTEETITGNFVEHSLFANLSADFVPFLNNIMRSGAAGCLGDRLTFRAIMQRQKQDQELSELAHHSCWRLVLLLLAGHTQLVDDVLVSGETRDPNTRPLDDIENVDFEPEGALCSFIEP